MRSLCKSFAYDNSLYCDLFFSQVYDHNAPFGRGAPLDEGKVAVTIILTVVILFKWLIN